MKRPVAALATRCLVLAAAAAAVLALLSCAASPAVREAQGRPDTGATAQAAAEAAAAASADATAEAPPAGPRVVRGAGQDGLQIVTRPEEARVYLDNRYVGLTPLFLQDVPAGRYKVTLRRSGYYAAAEWVDYSGGYLLYSATLQLITGFLKVDATPASADIRVAGEVLTAGRLLELPVGTHTLRARAFGYEEQTRAVEIREREITPLEIALQPAPLSLSGLRASHAAFNPRNAGLLGQIRVRFAVSGPGSGAIQIFDGEGREVHAAELPPFETWEQSFVWDGRDGSGEALPDGVYRLRLTATADGRSVQGELPLRVDSSIHLAYRSLWSGSAGTLYCPTPEVLPGGSLQLATFLMGGGGTEGVDVPVALAARLGIGEARRFELDALAGAIPGYEADSPLPLFAAAAFKAPLLRFSSGSLSGSTAAQAKLAYQSAGEDRLADFSGLSAGLPSALRFGALTVAASPELVLSAWRVSPAGQDIETGFTSWLYGRLAALLDFPPFGLAVSASFRSLPFQEGWGLDAPFHLGLEGHWLIAGTQLVLTVAASAELQGEGSPRLYGGGGLGLLR